MHFGWFGDMPLMWLANLPVPWNDHQTFVEVKLNSQLNFQGLVETWFPSSFAEVLGPEGGLPSVASHWVSCGLLEGIQAYKPQINWWWFTTWRVYIYFLFVQIIEPSISHWRISNVWNYEQVSGSFGIPLQIFRLQVRHNKWYLFLYLMYWI